MVSEIHYVEINWATAFKKRTFDYLRPIHYGRIVIEFKLISIKISYVAYAYVSYERIADGANSQTRWIYKNTR